VRLIRGRWAFAVAIVLTAAVGVASASAFRVGGLDPPLSDELEPVGAPPGQIGATVADPRGGPPWAVRLTPTPSGDRCAMAGRTDGSAFGPVNGAGAILDTGPSFSGSCAQPGAEPVQLAVARYPDLAGAGAGARTVLFGVAEATVTSVVVTHAGIADSLVPGLYRTFLVVREGRSDAEPWNVTVTLVDGTERSYIL
jgi:hypothetical protein